MKMHKQPFSAISHYFIIPLLSNLGRKIRTNKCNVNPMQVSCSQTRTAMKEIKLGTSSYISSHLVHSYPVLLKVCLSSFFGVFPFFPNPIQVALHNHWPCDHVSLTKTYPKKLRICTSNLCRWLGCFRSSSFNKNHLRK